MKVLHTSEYLELFKVVRLKCGLATAYCLLSLTRSYIRKYTQLINNRLWLTVMFDMLLVITTHTHTHTKYLPIYALRYIHDFNMLITWNDLVRFGVLRRNVEQSRWYTMTSKSFSVAVVVCHRCRRHSDWIKTMIGDKYWQIFVTYSGRIYVRWRIVSYMNGTVDWPCKLWNIISTNIYSLLLVLFALVLCLCGLRNEKPIFVLILPLTFRLPFPISFKSESATLNTIDLHKHTNTQNILWFVENECLQWHCRWNILASVHSNSNTMRLSMRFNFE